jgi:hypothetical protein
MTTTRKITLWITSVLAGLICYWVIKQSLIATFRKGLIQALSYEDEYGHLDVGPIIIPWGSVYLVAAVISFLLFYRIAPMVGKTLAAYTLLFVGAFGVSPILGDVYECGGFSYYQVWSCWESALFRLNELFGITIGCLLSFFIQPRKTERELARYLPKPIVLGTLDEDL